MKILAFCDLRYRDATRRVVGEGARLMTSPPVFASDVRPGHLEGRDFIYLDLHGKPGSVYLYAGPEQEYAALKLDTVREAHLEGAIVFATTCFLPQTPFLEAFLRAGARTVAGGAGKNYAGKERLIGAQHLAIFWMQALQAGFGWEQAFEMARRRLRLRLDAWVLDPRETRDTLAFRLWKAEDLSTDGSTDETDSTDLSTDALGPRADQGPRGTDLTDMGG